MFRNIILIGAVLLAGGRATSLPPRLLHERAACNRDNLFRCFIDTRYSAQATGFCSNLSPSTVTVGSTTATTTTTIEEQVTLDAIVNIVTSTTTLFTETIPTATTTLTLGVGTIAKRDDTASPPKCMTNGVTYPASRITSACSCIDVPASTVSVTYTVSTETVTQTTTSFTTPSATVTVWTTVSSVTSVGISTVTVGPPTGTDRIVNGDFETGNADGWELVPSSWQGTISSGSYVPTTGNWSYKITGDGVNIGRLNQRELIYLETGQYKIGLVASVMLFPVSSSGWGDLAVFEITNPTTGTNITVSLSNLPGSTKRIYGKAFAVPFNTNFTIPGNATGYNQLSLRYLTLSPPTTAAIDGIYLQKI